MSESLNRAFIKAYDKEKNSEAKRKAVSAERESQRVSELMMHFDTATVAIPAPHMLDARPAKSELRVGSTAPSDEIKSQPNRASSGATPSHAAPSTSALVDSVSESLRDSIASQMLQAGNWQDQPIDAFSGGFPMISTVHASSPRAQATVPTAAVASSAASEPPAAIQLPAEAVSKQDVKKAVVEASLPTESVPESEVVQGPGKEVAQRIVEAEPEAADFEQAGVEIKLASEASKPQVKEVETLVAPQAPALSDVEKDGAGDQKTTILHGRELAAKIEQRNRDGVIFRLDRPSYTKSQKPDPASQGLAAEDESDNDDSELQSSIIGDFASPPSDSHPNDSIKLDSSPKASRSYREENAPKHGFRSTADAERKRNQTEDVVASAAARSSANVENARAVEKDLRQARMRIFNPVWEVDSLQWPHVCVELLEQMNQNMNRVASNLISACEEGLQVLAVTSPQSGEGTTTVACCLALLAGAHGLNVAIVDGNIENPTLSYQTNLDVETDWLAAIMNQTPLEEVAIHSIDDQLTLVPLLNPVSHHELDTDDDRIASMLQELSDSFDLVIVDMGTMSATRNLVTTMGEQGLISAAVAVVDYRSSTPQTIENCLRQIRQAGITSIGLVENFAA